MLNGWNGKSWLNGRMWCMSYRSYRVRFARSIFLEYGYFSAEKFLVLAPLRSQASKNILRAKCLCVEMKKKRYDQK